MSHTIHDDIKLSYVDLATVIRVENLEVSPPFSLLWFFCILNCLLFFCFFRFSIILLPSSILFGLLLCCSIFSSLLLSCSLLFCLLLCSSILFGLLLCCSLFLSLLLCCSFFLSLLLCCSLLVCLLLFFSSFLNRWSIDGASSCVRSRDNIFAVGVSSREVRFS